VGRWIPSAAVIVVGVALVAGCGGGNSESATPDTTAVTETSGGGDAGSLTGSVGPGFEISMGQDTVAAGTFTLTVDDMATNHNFHFTGPGGVDVKTEVSEEGTKTFEVVLEPGTYTFVCDPHAGSMNGTLTVTG
jgi:plastocyanin